MSRVLLLATAVAALGGLGYLGYVSDALAYAGSAPETCNNCHVMDSQYENWYQASHHLAGVCTECHLPHDNFVVYYAEKGRQGMKDTWAFTTGAIPSPIHASSQTRVIVQQNCIRCHDDVVDSMLTGPQPFDRYCWDCHRQSAHGARGISVVPMQDSSSYPLSKERKP